MRSGNDTIACMLRKTLLLTIGIAFVSFGADSKQALDGFDTFAGQVLKDWNAVGFAVAIIQDGKVVYTKGYGLRDLKGNQPVTPQTLFAIGSSRLER